MVLEKRPGRKQADRRGSRQRPIVLPKILFYEVTVVEVISYRRWGVYRLVWACR